MFIEIPINNYRKNNKAIINTDNITAITTNKLNQVEIYTNDTGRLITTISYEELREVLINGKEKV